MYNVCKLSDFCGVIGVAVLNESMAVIFKMRVLAKNNTKIDAFSDSGNVECASPLKEEREKSEIHPFSLQEPLTIFLC